MKYFEDYIKKSIPEETIELIDFLYEIVEEVDPPKNRELGLSFAYWLIRGMLQTINKSVWQTIIIEKPELKEYANNKIRDFFPTIKTESGYFEMNNEIDAAFKHIRGNVSIEPQYYIAEIVNYLLGEVKL